MPGHFIDVPPPLTPEQRAIKHHDAYIQRSSQKMLSPLSEEAQRELHYRETQKGQTFAEAMRRLRKIEAAERKRFFSDDDWDLD